ncbi:MAG: enoyl-CoA hydratase-related protein [Roseiarcus sp.]|jgi:2-(1,2-epoxy-1,2-dihydrophenyl)acetyl-CoA isomerase
MNDDSPIRLTVEAGIARIVLDRPDEGNPIGDEAIAALDRVTLECADRQDVRAVLISARGPRFSVGGNVREFVADRQDLSTYIRRVNLILNGCLARLHRMEAPSVVAVQGVAAGGAVSILSGCDIVVAAESARFVAAYASIGYCPDIGGTINLARRIGLARARRFHLLHEQLDAATAERIGLVDQVVPQAQVLAAAEAIAQRWAQGPTRAYGAIRRLMHGVHCTPMETQLELETQELAQLTRTDDAWEALNAFLAKRKPAYRGR